MHSTRHGGVVFIHHGDYSGHVEIRLACPGEGDEHHAVTVPNDALLAFVADQIRRRLIDDIEDMSADEVLAIARPWERGTGT